jgi:hypothetical protein
MYSLVLKRKHLQTFSKDNCHMLSLHSMQSPSQCTSSSHDNPKHLSRQSTLSPGMVQHLNSQFWPDLHYFALASDTKLYKTINNFNNMALTKFHQRVRGYLSKIH